MAYDEVLAERIRRALARRQGISERKMFGGIAFMLHGNMLCGVVDDRLMLRLGPEEGDAALQEPHALPMDFTGKPMRGMVYVLPEGIVTHDELNGWLQRALRFARTLPRKQAAPRKKK